MSDSQLYHAELTRLIKKLIDDALKGFRPSLRQTTGTIPAVQLPPAQGSTGGDGPSRQGAVVMEDALAQNVSTSGAAGSSGHASRGDHVHGLPNTGVSAGSYGDATHVGAFTVDAKGRLTAASSVAISGTTPAAHHTTHESGGSDVLTGLLDATARVAVRKNSGGTNVGARRRLNLIEGTNITLTVADDGASEEVDITIDAAASGDATSLQGIAIAASAPSDADRLRYDAGMDEWQPSPLIWAPLTDGDESLIFASGDLIFVEMTP
jgi:hypothetical protein